MIEIRCKHMKDAGYCEIYDDYCVESPCQYYVKKVWKDEEEIMEWISVEERLPEDQEEVLVCTKSKKGMRNIDKGYYSIDHFIHRGCAQVTHWMPLPEFPKMEGDEVE